MSPPYIFRIDELIESPSFHTYENIESIRRAGATLLWASFGMGSALQMGGYTLPTGYQPFFWIRSSVLSSSIQFEGIAKDLAIYLAICVFASSVTQLYYLHKHNPHQQRYLMGGILLGISLGLALERDLQRAILNVMPWFILLSLLLSIAAHGIWHGRTIDSATDRTSLSTVSNKEKMDLMDVLVEEAPV